MFVIMFRSRLSEAAGGEYHATNDRMMERAREIAGSDLVEVKHFTAADGERLTVVFWEDPETLEQWRIDPEHARAQRLGREKWYTSYELTVAEVIRTSTGGVNLEAAPAGEPG